VESVFSIPRVARDEIGPPGASVAGLSVDQREQLGSVVYMRAWSTAAESNHTVLKLQAPQVLS